MNREEELIEQVNNLQRCMSEQREENRQRAGSLYSANKRIEGFKKRIAELKDLIDYKVFPSMGDGFSGDYVSGYERALSDMCKILKEQDDE